jgi:hypothetical protein
VAATHAVIAEKLDYRQLQRTGALPDSPAAGVLADHQRADGTDAAIGVPGAVANPKPVGTSGARPGGNLTGINFLNVDVTTKRLELLRELVPGGTRVAVLVNPTNDPVAELALRHVSEAAGTLGVQIQLLCGGFGRSPTGGRHGCCDWRSRRGREPQTCGHFRVVLSMQ